MKTFSTSLALCEGNPPVTGGFPSQRPVTRSFDVFFDLRLNKRLSTQSICRWFETPLHSLWRHCNDQLVNFFMFWYDIFVNHQITTAVISLVSTSTECQNTPKANTHDITKWKRGALMFSLICARRKGWVNNRDAGDLWRYRAHYGVTVMQCSIFYVRRQAITWTENDPQNSISKYRYVNVYFVCAWFNIIQDWLSLNSDQNWTSKKTSGPQLKIKTVFPGYSISVIKIRRSSSRLIFIMVVSLLVRYLYAETAPCFLNAYSSSGLYGVISLIFRE